jgi:hypothetical protein
VNDRSELFFSLFFSKVVKENVTELLNGHLEQARHLQKQVSRPGTYYHDELFVLAPFLHSLQNVSQILVLDVDLKFLSDVNLLFSEFANFSEAAFVGVAPELSPVYHHLLYKYRKANPGTRFGSTDPKHMQGINSGVLLVDVDKMRNSQNYTAVLEPDAITRLFEHFQIDGRASLGDQDFLALLSFEHPEFFHFLPCGWNRALCQFWRKVYPDIFDQYFFCDDQVKVYHGNCDSVIPP